MAKKKKQFQKEIVLSDEEIYVDSEAELEKEAFQEVLKSAAVKQEFNEPPHNTFLISIREHYLEIGLTHRDYLCKMYSLDPEKGIGIDTQKCKVFNFDFQERQGKTLPDYIQDLGYDWTHFCNYDLALEDKTLRDYLMKY